MLKRGLIVSLVLTGLFLAAWSPIGAQSAPTGVELQATYPAPGPTIQITVVVPTRAATPSASGTGMPSTVVIGLLIVVALAVIIGGVALVSKGRES